jgi:hypothetical protein
LPFDTFVNPISTGIEVVNAGFPAAVVYCACAGVTNSHIMNITMGVAPRRTAPLLKGKGLNMALLTRT